MRSHLCLVLACAILAGACSGGDENGSSSNATVPTAPSPAPASPNPAPAPSSSICSLSVTGLPSSVASQSSRHPFTISLPATCAWTARTDVGWADIAPGSGNGNSTATLNVNENEFFSARTFTVTINGQAFRVTQNVPGCSYSVDPTTLDESGSGSIARVNVTTGSNCPWTATASEGWLRVTNSAGTGSAVVLIEVAENPGDVRNAFLTVAGQRVNVSQRRR